IWGAGPPAGGRTGIQKLVDPLVPAALTTPLIAGAGAVAAPARAVPYVGKAMPVAARVATAAGIGAATEPDKPVRGAVKGAVEQAVGGEALAPIATRIAQRFGARAFERLSDELADQIMTRAQALSPEGREA